MDCAAFEDDLLVLIELECGLANFFGARFW